MKWIKRIVISLLLIFTALFLKYGVEYDYGYKYPKTKKCLFAKGQKKVYVHWIKMLNNTTSTFCDYTLTPRYYKNAGDFPCNCDK
jgi:hypothetical protein